MKKVFSLIAVAVTALGFASCNKELVEDVNASEEIEIDITVAGLSGPGTKAVKSGWTPGDKINIWYNENIQNLPDLVIVYNGSSWTVDASAAVSGNTVTTGGTLNAVYENSPGGLSSYRYQTVLDYASFYTKETDYFKLNMENINRRAYYSYLIAASSKNNFTISTNLVTRKKVLVANLDNWIFPNNVQVVITGLTYTSENWCLMCDKLYAIGGFNISPSSGVIEGGTRGKYYEMSVPNAEGRAWYFHAFGSTGDIEFSICNRVTGKKYQYKTTGSFDKDLSKLRAISIPFSKFTEVTE